MKCPNCGHVLTRKTLARGFGDSKKGGQARAASMTEDQRKALAHKAAEARWGKK